MHWFLILLALLAGATVPVQAAINAKAVPGVGSPLGAAFLSFVTGAATLALVILILRPPMPTRAALAALPWWAYVGGVIGAGFVAVALTLTPRMGALVLIMCITLGQLAASVCIDSFGWLGLPVRDMTPGRWAGLGLLVAGAACLRLL